MSSAPVGPWIRRDPCAHTLAAIAGHDPRDPQTWDVPIPDYAAALDGNINGLKVGIISERVHTDANDPEVRDAVIAATAVLAGLGAEVREVSIPLIVNSSEISYGIISSDAAMLNWDIISTERLRELDHKWAASCPPRCTRSRCGCGMRCGVRSSPRWKTWMYS
ncbi:MAG: hypothetical protein J4G13_14065 [Dehalococcoidia bacterium]|nr:hypothetical protein [Dehalococcoidia bacterium]